VRRTIALVVDDLGLSFESTNYVRRALRKFVDQQMRLATWWRSYEPAAGLERCSNLPPTSDSSTRPSNASSGFLMAARPSGLSRPWKILQQNDRQQAFNEEFNQFLKMLLAVGTLARLAMSSRECISCLDAKSILLISDGFADL